ncbi:putative conserved membrane protein [Synechococcus sp. BMK-MC-1]|nr:putative conserved membrane protein [Synechococcus sp. BMK-MC-1]
MDLMTAPTISLLIFGAFFAALQIWWIGSLMIRNRRRSSERPLTTSQFRRDLERIFKNNA